LKGYKAVLAKIMLMQPKQQFAKETGELLHQISRAPTGTAADSRKTAFAAVCAQVMQGAFRKADEFTKKIPVPSIVKKNLSKADVAFIAAAYAIPLPGTALFAAAMIGSKHGCRHLRNRLKPKPIVDASAMDDTCPNVP
jgi:hypothetical protein